MAYDFSLLLFGTFGAFGQPVTFHARTVEIDDCEIDAQFRTPWQWIPINLVFLPSTADAFKAQLVAHLTVQVSSLKILFSSNTCSFWTILILFWKSSQ